MLKFSVPALMLAALALAACQSSGNSMTAGAGGSAVQYDGYTKQQHDNDRMTDFERRQRWYNQGRGL